MILGSKKSNTYVLALRRDIKDDTVTQVIMKAWKNVSFDSAILSTIIPVRSQPSVANAFKKTIQASVAPSTNGLTLTKSHKIEVSY